MRVLVVGSGAREHALVLRLSRELGPDSIVASPGNPGMAGLVRTRPANMANPDDLLAVAAQEEIDLTVIGPELPLSVGVADRFTENGRLIVGPTMAAARLESSKAFAKAFMARHHVPTASFHTSETLDDAMEWVRSGSLGFPVVLKADGLAAGKGVVIASDLAEAEAAVLAAMSGRKFGDAGSRLVIEECLTGSEVSFFVLCDGAHALPIGTAQDHKRIFDDDRGPNTGGMGAFAPSPLVNEAIHARVMDEIVGPVMRGMSLEGHPFTGFLYVGLMLTAAGPKVIEFNVRLGDPEAQVVLPLLADPIVPLLLGAARGELGSRSCAISSDKLVGVVLASGGYPEATSSGQRIRGIDRAEHAGAVVFHAGTALADGDLVTAGGRVLTVVGRGATFVDAIERAYAGVYCISFEGMQYRTDIGRKAL